MNDVQGSQYLVRRKRGIGFIGARYIFLKLFFVRTFLTVSLASIDGWNP